MEGEISSKLKIVCLIRILMEKTDETHEMTMQEILSALEGYGIHAERKSVYSDMEQLRLFGLDIIKEQHDKNAFYHLGSRRFELAELKLLVDSVQAARFITEKKSNELIKKIEGLASKYEAGQLQHQVYVTERVKSENEQILYNIDAIHRAIAENSKITFQYFNWNEKKEMCPRHDGALYEVSPWALTLADENYYLVSYDKERGIRYFRVDKMLKINLTDEMREGKELFRQFDIAAYAKKRFFMFDGAEEKVELLCKNEFAGVIIDRFGKEIPMRKDGENHFRATVNVAVSDQFLAWILAMKDAAKVVGPKKVVDKMRSLIEEASGIYK